MEIHKIPWSIDTVCRTSAKNGDDQYQQLNILLRKIPKFAIQLHEMANASTMAQLLQYMLYVCSQIKYWRLLFVVFWSATPEVKMICSLTSIKFCNCRFAMRKLHLILYVFLRNMFVWSSILKIDNHEVQKPVLFEKCWECSSSCIVCIHQQINNLCKNHQLHPSHQLSLVTFRNWIVFSLICNSLYCFYYVLLS